MGLVTHSLTGVVLSNQLARADVLALGFVSGSVALVQHQQRLNLVQVVDTVLPVLTAAVIARDCTAVVHGQADKTLGDLGVGAQELV